MKRLTTAALFALLLGLLAVTTAQAKGGNDCSGGSANASHCDLDGDGIANKHDPDIDGDGIANEEDACPRDADNECGEGGEDPGPDPTIPDPTTIVDPSTLPDPTTLVDPSTLPDPTTVVDPSTLPDPTTVVDPSTLPDPTTLVDPSTLPDPTTLIPPVAPAA